MQRALILQAGDTIYPNDLLFDQSLQPSINKSLQPSINSQQQDINSHQDFISNNQSEAVLEEVSVNYSADLKQREYEIIITALNDAGGSKKQAAEKLGISPRTLRYKMAKMRESGLSIS